MFQRCEGTRVPPRVLGRNFPPHDTVGARAAAAAVVARLSKDVGGVDGDGVVGVRARGQRGERRGGRRYGRLAGEVKECVGRACKG